jgi:hypothetical protein
MAVEIREIVLTARVTERSPATGAPTASASASGQLAPREIIDACLAELRAWLERRSDR